MAGRGQVSPLLKGVLDCLRCGGFISYSERTNSRVVYARRIAYAQHMHHNELLAFYSRVTKLFRPHTPQQRGQLTLCRRKI